MLPDRFRRQFIAAPRPVDGFAAWRHARLGALHVYAHPDLGLTVAGGIDGGVQVVLLGFAIDPEHPEMDDAAVAARIAVGRTLEEVIAAAVDLAGRWVLLAASGGGLYALNDACGLRAVHYTVAKEGPYLASNPALLGRLVPLRPSAFADEYLASEYRRRTVEHWLPSGTTLFEGVGHLVPNHYLRMEEGEQVRYWPTMPLPSHPMRESVPRAATLLRKLVAAGAARFPLALPITAGWDSRLLLGAATRPLADQLFAYTLVYRALNDASPDVRIPREMFRANGLAHHTLECTAPAPAEFLGIYRDSVDLPHDDWAGIAWGMHRGYPQERVCLKGNGAEIARSFYSGLRADPTPRAVAEQEIGGLSFAVEALERWMEPAREVCAAVGMDVLDLLYMEHRMGSWQARSQLEWDLVQEAYTPYNHRPLLVEMLGVPRRDRDEPKARMWRALLRELWPELGRWPVNPLPARQRVRRAARSLLDQTGLLLPLRTAYRRYRAFRGR
jgi:hypothetical protein